jgi:hypothetical protein
VSISILRELLTLLNLRFLFYYSLWYIDTSDGLKPLSKEDYPIEFLFLNF